MLDLSTGLRVVALSTALLAVACSASQEEPGPAPSRAAATKVAAIRFPEPATAPLPAARTAALQAVLDRVVAEHAFYAGSGAPGVTAAVLTDRGFWMGAAGRGGDGKKLVPHAMQGIASITKTFTAAEVLHLADGGLVDLDAPMSSYVEHRLTANGATVRQALGMRSGIVSRERDVTALLRAQLAAPGRHWTPQEALTYQRSDLHPPGGDPSYNDASYWLLGLLVERVTGRPFAEALRADLLAPAGLDRVAVQDAERPMPPFGAPPRRLRLAPDGYLACRACASAGTASGGMAADAPTLARWGYQLYGARLLPATTVRAMITQPSVGTVFPGVGYGLGTMAFLDVGTEAIYGHTGRSPAYSMLAVTPARHLSVAILIPDEDRDTFAVMEQLLAALRARVVTR